MKNLTVSNPSGRTLRCLLLLLVVGLSTIASKESNGQTLTTHTRAIPAPCPNTDNPCCYNLVFTGGPNNLATIRFQFSNPTCWDFNACFLNQFPPGTTWILNGPGDYTISFIPPIPAFPVVTIWWICMLPTCVGAPGSVTWTGSDGSNGIAFFGNCSGGTHGEPPGPCPTCNQTELQFAGYYDYANAGCFDRACFTKRLGAAPSMGPFRVHFTPPWSPCPQPAVQWTHHWPDGTTTYGPPCNPDNRPTPTGPDGSIATPHPVAGGIPPYDYIDFILTSPIEECSGFCINIPQCEPRIHYTVEIEDLSDPGHDCAPPPSMDFKKGIVSVTTSAGQTNFPNPVTEANQFKTTIPFEIANEGSAKISIFDATGKVIHTEISTFAGSGKHFFYFTATDVPTGSYFYTIESPLGVTIVKKSLLIVK